MKKYIALFVSFLLSSALFAQLGPGGISTEAPNWPLNPTKSNLTIWLDANSITVADGSYIDRWTDEAPYRYDNSANSPSSVLKKPVIWKDPSVGINGNPIIRFGAGRRLLFSTSPDINTPSSPSYIDKKTIFAVVRTGSDITSRQIIYEEGGNVRGLNMFIYNSKIYLGAYDIVKDGDKTPKWNFTSTSTAIAPYTTYIISMEFNAPTPPATDGYIRGYLNGVHFGTDASGVGTLYRHPDVPGIGTVNGNTVVEGNKVHNDGSFPLLGDLSELIHYLSVLNNAERIIVENYLSAKYSALGLPTEIYTHIQDHPHEVIGVGQATGSHNRHLISRGRNPFTISIPTTQLNNNEWFMCGNNKGSLTEWTPVGAPPVNTLILPRHWRANHFGNVGDITLTLEGSEMPISPDPSTYSKYALVVDPSGGVTPNFDAPTTEVHELVSIGGGRFRTTAPIPNNAFFTIGLLYPSVQFTQATFYGFEATANKNVQVPVRLNYRPVTSTNIYFNVADDTAVQGVDFENISSSPVQIAAKQNTGNISFDIIGDTNSEDTKQFFLNLDVSAGLKNETPESSIFYIYDNDNLPEFSFVNNIFSWNENITPATQTIEVVRTGSTSGEARISCRLSISGADPTQGTATHGTDYTIATGTLVFADGETSKTIPISIIDDTIDETDETIKVELYNPIGADLSPTKNICTITLINDDLPSQISFTETSGNNSERIDEPAIQVSLSQASSKDIMVDYRITGGTATNALDYSTRAPSTLIIPAGETQVFLPLRIINDQLFGEPQETIEIELFNPINASLSTTNTHFTYYIDDYIPFEWTASAGVGLAADNVIWINADKYSNGNLNKAQDQSPNDNDAIATYSSYGPTVVANAIGGHKAISFDNWYEYLYFNSHINISTASNYDSKFNFMVIRTSSDINSTQMLFETGGEQNGTSLYISGGKLYWMIWNNSKKQSVSTTISTSTNYLISSSYYYNTASDNGIELYVNGALVGSSYNNVRQLKGQNDKSGLGGSSGSSRIHSGVIGSGSYYKGQIAELIHYSDHQMNEFRRKVVENYLAAKYQINFTNSTDDLYPYKGTHGNDLVGIGDYNNSYHLDAQGPWSIRIKKTVDQDNGEYVFVGHDNGNWGQNTTDVPFGLSYRLGRVWRYHKEGDPGALNMSFTIKGLTYDAGSEIELLYDTDGTFLTGAVQVDAEKSWDPINEVLTFKNIDLPSGVHFTLGFSPKYWTGILSDDWNNAGNWRGYQLPTSTTNVLITSSPIGSRFPRTNSGSASHTFDCVIESGASVFIPNNKGLTVYGDLKIQGSLKFGYNESTTGTLITNGNVTGSMKQSRIRNKHMFHLYGLPVASLDREKMAGEYLFIYDETITDAWNTTLFTSVDSGWVSAAESDLVGTYGELTGYIQASAYTTIHFEGKPNTGTFSTSLSFTNTPEDDSFDGWNLLGNPYPSYLDWDMIANDPVNEDIQPTIYYYKDISGEPDTDSYATYSSLTGVGINAGSRYIPPHQGFFVKTTTNGANFTVRNDMRLHASQSFFKKAESPKEEISTSKKNSNVPLQFDHLQLRVSNGDKTDETALLSIEDAKEEFDINYDAYKLKATSQKTHTVYTNNKFNNKLAVNAQYFANLDTAISLCVQSPFAADIEIRPTICRFADGRPVFLYDKFTGTFHNLNSGESVLVSVEKGSVENRFEIRFSDKKRINTNGADKKIFAANKTVYVDNETTEMLTVRVMNTTGKCVASEVQTSQAFIRLPVLQTGVYIVQVVNLSNNKISSRKVWVK